MTDTTAAGVNYKPKLPSLGQIGAMLRRGDLMLAIGVIGILVVLIMPLPPMMLDMLLALSLILSVLILMTALFIQGPLEFSAFPAVLLIATVIGIPLGFGILFFLLPAPWFIGYLVAGAALGTAILRAGRSEQAEHRYLPVLVGLGVFQIVALVPFIGGMVAFFAGLAGGGALLYRMWTAFRGTPAGRPTMPPTIPAAPTA